MAHNHLCNGFADANDKKTGIRKWDALTGSKACMVTSAQKKPAGKFRKEVCKKDYIETNYKLCSLHAVVMQAEKYFGQFPHINLTVNINRFSEQV